jgi:hypothetical protein
VDNSIYLITLRIQKTNTAATEVTWGIKKFKQSLADRRDKFITWQAEMLFQERTKPEILKQQSSLEKTLLFTQHVLH